MHRVEENGQLIKDIEKDNKKHNQVLKESSALHVVTVQKVKDVDEQQMESDDMGKLESNKIVSVEKDEKEAMEN